MTNVFSSENAGETFSRVYLLTWTFANSHSVSFLVSEWVTRPCCGVEEPVVVLHVLALRSTGSCCMSVLSAAGGYLRNFRHGA